MSVNGLDVFDKTIQQTNVWLDEIMEDVGPDRKLAWHVLGGVLRTLRDRLQPELALHVSAQLPLLVRGIFFEGWRSPVSSEKYRHESAFLEHLVENTIGGRPVDPTLASRAVFGVLSRHLDVGLVRKVIESLPAPIRAHWPVRADEGPSGGLVTDADEPWSRIAD